MSTTLRLTNEDGTITIETHRNVDGCDEFINQLVRPILKAVGYQDVTVNEYIGDFEEVASQNIKRLTDVLMEYCKQDDGGVTSSPDYNPDFEGDPDEESFATEYVDPYDAQGVSRDVGVGTITVSRDGCALWGGSTGVGGFELTFVPATAPEKPKRKGKKK